MSFFEEISEKGIYFLFKENCDPFAQLSICLAEGLKDLSIPLYSNRNFWQTNLDPVEYLIANIPECSPADCALCVVDLHLCSGNDAQLLLESALQLSGNTPVVVLDPSEADLDIPAFQAVNYIFRAHMRASDWYPENFVPWIFGISKRIQYSTEPNIPFKAREKIAIAGFRPSLNQSVRIALDFVLLPWLEEYFSVQSYTDSPVEMPLNIDHDSFHYLNWLQVKSRHNPQYYDRLKKSMICCAYGGNFMYIGNYYMYSGDRPGVVRWDSWRWWESLAAGCVTLNLDVEKFGFQMPIMPENWKHYVGLDLKNCKEDMERLRDEPELMEYISIEGRKWALEHYSPVPIACYFLDIITEQELGTTKFLLSLIQE